jgi:hypothetical protein
MRAIARNAALASLALWPAIYAGAREDIQDLFATMGAALTTPNAARFMAAFDKKMPGFDQLSRDIAALTNQAEVSSSIEPIKNEGDESERSVDLDWYLEIRSLQQAGPITHRREVIHCELKKQKSGWKIVALKPLEFFAPAKLDQ